MLAKWILALMPVIGLAANVMLQVTLYRTQPRLGLLKSLLSAFGAGLLGVAIITLCLEGRAALSVDGLALLLVNAGAYAALGFCYFNFVNLIVTARRIRMLNELANSPGGLTLDEIVGRYDGAEMVRNRVERLERSKQIALRDGRYYIRRKTMLTITRLIIFMKLLVMGKRSEFD